MNLKSRDKHSWAIRAAAPDDEEGVHRVVAAAFDDGGNVADLWAEVEARGHSRASVVAVESDEVVGHVGISDAWLDARRALVDVWMLSPLSTRPDRERRGIGTALVEAAIGAARDGSVPALFLEGSPDFYGARGFERASDRGFLPASLRTPDRAFQVVTFGTHEEWMTGALVYRDVWWEHDSAGLRDPVLAELEESLGRVRTYVR